MEGFANFWLNKIERPKGTMTNLAVSLGFISANYLNHDFSSECTNILENKFLTFVKTNLENEQSWSF